jgi:allantoin racemase
MGTAAEGRGFGMIPHGARPLRPMPGPQASVPPSSAESIPAADFSAPLRGGRSDARRKLPLDRSGKRLVVDVIGRAAEDAAAAREAGDRPDAKRGDLARAAASTHHPCVKILVINPNTSEDITERIRGTAAGMHPRIAFKGATGRFGARYIASRAASAIAAHAAIDAYAEHGGGCDAVLLACFGDPGLLALREIAAVPVVGLAEASCREAADGGRRFAIVTGGERWKPMLEEFVAAIGLSASCAGIRCVAPTGAEIAADPAGARALLSRAGSDCARDDGADIVILAGAGLVGMAEAVAADVPIPLICSVRSGVDAVVAAATAPFSKPPAGDLAAPPAVPTIGLGQALAGMLSAGSAPREGH